MIVDITLWIFAGVSPHEYLLGIDPMPEKKRGKHKQEFQSVW